VADAAEFVVLGHPVEPVLVVYVLHAGAQMLLLPPAQQGPAGPETGQLAMFVPLKLPQVLVALFATMAEVQLEPELRQYAPDAPTLIAKAVLLGH